MPCYGNSLPLPYLSKNLLNSGVTKRKTLLPVFWCFNREERAKLQLFDYLTADTKNTSDANRCQEQFYIKI
jgi:hypothetical protein